jgi:hypothetical protein
LGTEECNNCIEKFSKEDSATDSHQAEKDSESSKTGHLQLSTEKNKKKKNS